MIRKFKASDIDAINIIGNQISENFVDKYDVINNEKKDYVDIIIYDDGIIKGFTLIEDHIDFIDIIAIAVDNNFKHQGIGYQMINYIVENYKKRILLEVKETNEPAIKLYEKAGFKIINIRKKYYNGIDALIMERSV